MKPHLLAIFLLASVLLKAQVKPVAWHCLERNVAKSAIVSIFDTIPICSDYTVISVYRSNVPTSQHMWRLILSDSAYVGNTTSGFYNDKLRIDGIVPDIVRSQHIELFQQKLRVNQLIEKQYVFAIGEVCEEKSDVEFSEIAFFDKKLTTKEASPFQTYLALKYGITMQNVDYTLATGDVLWSAVIDSMYYNRIVGVGCDTLYGFKGYTSVQCNEEPTVKLIVDTLRQGQFLIVGDDGKSLSYSWRDTLNYVVERNWKLKPYGMADFSNVKIVVDPFYFGFEPHSCRMVVYDGVCDNIYAKQNYRIIAPDSVDVFGMVYFSNVKIDGDKSGSDIVTFTGCPIPELENRSWKQSSEEDYSTLSGVDIVLYPNPTHGDYTIDISTPDVQKIEVRIYNSIGQIVDYKILDGSDSYHITNHIDVPQLYHIEFGFKSGTIVKNLLVQ